MTKDYNLQNGINLYTIHSSKGLEFDMVLCPYLSIISNKSNKIKGPIWKSNIDRNIYINISNNYAKVEKFKLIEEEDLFKESERLIYVALTRSKYKLIVFNDLDDTNNILNNDLLNNLEDISIYKSTFIDILLLTLSIFQRLLFNPLIWNFAKISLIFSFSILSSKVDL